jgi:hypothetical protein
MTTAAGAATLGVVAVASRGVTQAGVRRRRDLFQFA